MNHQLEDMSEYNALINFFFLGRNHKDIQDFVANYYVCQTSKYWTRRPYGLLQPSEFPEQVSEDITLDFIVGLPCWWPSL